MTIDDDGVTVYDKDGNVKKNVGKHYDKTMAVIGAVEGALMLIAVAGYLLLGLLLGFWASGWIVFFLPEVICSIARAIVNNPKLLLCDEPTGNLDPEKSMEIMEVLEDINKNRGTTIIMATHDKEIVNKLKKQVITLKEGRLVNHKKKGKYEDEAI